MSKEFKGINPNEKHLGTNAESPLGNENIKSIEGEIEAVVFSSDLYKDRKLSHLNQKGRLPRSGLILGGAALLAASSFAGYKGLLSSEEDPSGAYLDVTPLTQGVNRDFWENPEGNDPMRGEGIDGIREYFLNTRGIEGDLEEKDEARLKTYIFSKYNSARSGLINYVEYELLNNYNTETIESINETRQKMTVDGIKIVKDYIDSDFFKINEEDSTVSIGDGREFDLNNTTDLILLDQITKYLIRDYRNNTISFQKEIDDLVWFTNSGINIKARDDAILFIDDEGLIVFSRFYQMGDTLGFPRPEKLFYIPHSGKGNYGGRYRNDMLYINNEARSRTPTHEAAHDLAKHHPVYNQEAFDSKVTATRQSQMNEEEIKESSAFAREYGKTNSKEDYAVTLEQYFIEGNAFRSKLKSLYLNNDPDYEILLAKYNFTKDLFEGREFMRNGELFDPQEGDVYRISFPSKSKGGLPVLLLKSDGNSNHSEENNPLSNREGVQIVSSDKIEFYNTSMQINSHLVQIMTKDGRTGWIDKIWLGELIEKGNK